MKKKERNLQKNWNQKNKMSKIIIVNHQRKWNIWNGWNK